MSIYTNAWDEHPLCTECKKLKPVFFTLESLPVDEYDPVGILAWPMPTSWEESITSSLKEDHPLESNDLSPQDS
jgi:hypothetical protein